MSVPRPLPWLLLALVVAGIVLRGGVTPGNAAWLHVGVGLVGIWAALLGRWHAASRDALLLVWAWVGLCASSLLWSRHADATLDGTAAVAATGLVFLLGAGLSDRRSRRRFVVGFAVLGAIVAGLAVASVQPGERASTPFGNPNHLASWLMLPAAIACLATLSVDVARRGRREDALLGFGVVAVTGAGIAATSSLGACVAVIAAIASLGALRRLGVRPGLALAASALAATALGLMAFPFLAPEWLSTAAGGTESSPGLRWAVWSAGARAALDAAPLGVGLGAFPDAFAQHRPEGMVYAARHAHSEPLHGLVELGLPFVVLGLATGWVAVQRIGRRLVAVPSSFRWGATTALVALAAHSLVDFPLHVPAIALTAAVLAGALWGGVPTPRHGPPAGLVATRVSLAALALLCLTLAGSQGFAARSATRAAAHTELGAFDTAIAIAERGLWVRPQHADLLRELARASEHAYRFGAGGAESLVRATETRRRAARLHPTDARLQLELARTLARAGDRDGALAAITRAADLDPISPVAHLERARLLLDDGAPEQAAHAVRRAVERHPRALEPAATALLRASGRPETLQHSLPPEPVHQRRVAGVLARAGYTRPAAEAYTRALDAAPADTELALRAARLFESSGDPGAALAVLRRTLAHAPDDTGLRSSLERLQRVHDALPPVGAPAEGVSG